MPMITPIGVVRQTTMLAQRVRGAVEEANSLTAGEGQTERVRDAKLFTREINLWMQHAERNGWDLVVRHASTQLTLAMSEITRLAS